MCTTNLVSILMRCRIQTTVSPALLSKSPLTGSIHILTEDKLVRSAMIHNNDPIRSPINNTKNLTGASAEEASSHNSLWHFDLSSTPVAHSFKHAACMTSSSCRGAGVSPKTISQLNSSKLGFIVRGMPSSSVKKVCTGALHKFTHIPAHLLSAKYLHKPFVSNHKYLNETYPALCAHFTLVLSVQHKGIYCMLRLRGARTLIHIAQSPDTQDVCTDWFKASHQCSDWTSLTNLLYPFPAKSQVQTSSTSLQYNKYTLNVASKHFTQGAQQH